jgi:hypothetical protein
MGAAHPRVRSGLSPQGVWGCPTARRCGIASGFMFTGCDELTVVEHGGCRRVVKSGAPLISTELNLCGIMIPYSGVW